MIQSKEVELIKKNSMWGPWQFPQSEEQKEQWRNIPTKVFWVKMTVLLGVCLLLGVLLVLVINN